MISPPASASLDDGTNEGGGGREEDLRRKCTMPQVWPNTQTHAIIHALLLNRTNTHVLHRISISYYSIIRCNAAYLESLYRTIKYFPMVLHNQYS